MLLKPRMRQTLRFPNLVADRFVFNFAGFINRNVGSVTVGDAAFFAVDVGRRQGW